MLQLEEHFESIVPPITIADHPLPFSVKIVVEEIYVLLTLAWSQSHIYDSRTTKACNGIEGETVLPFSKKVKAQVSGQMSTNFRGLTTSYILLTNQQRTLKSIEQTASKYLKFCLSFTFTRIEDGICFRPVCGVIACKFAQHQNVRQNTNGFSFVRSFFALLCSSKKKWQLDDAGPHPGQTVWVW
jgi:hypothetical protein